MEKALTVQGGLQAYLEKSNKQIDKIVELVRGKLSTMNRITLGALTVIDVHGMCPYNTSIHIHVVYICTLKPKGGQARFDITSLLNVFLIYLYSVYV